jgi:hypothetical protein
VDAVIRPRQALAFAAGVAGVVLLVDFLLGMGLRAGERQDDLYFNSAPQVHRYLAKAARTPGPAWLLVGDSVLAGDSIRPEVPDWNRRRVVDYLRAEKRPDAPQQFHQVALNGLLPVDMLRILRELEACDPRGRIGVALEINRRYFSAGYAEQPECTRPWLDELAPRVASTGQVDFGAWLRIEARTAAGVLRGWLPVFRHADDFGNPLRDGLEAVWRGTGQVETEDAFAVQARMREHFRAVVMEDWHEQMRVLREILTGLKHSGRPAVLFTPPLNDAHMNDLVTPRQYGADLARLADVVERAGAPQVRLVHLDHPMFQESMFKDIAHMFPEGNRLLAVNLLEAMNVPLSNVPPSAECVYPEAPDATLLWNLYPGDNEGSAWMAAFREVGGLDVDERQRIVIADTGNHCLREWRPELGTVRTVAGQPGLQGYRDGPLDEALLDGPAHPCIVGDKIFSADGGGRRLRQACHGMVLSEYPLDGPDWTEIRVVRAQGSRLYLLDAGRRILAYDTRIRTCRVVVEAASGEDVLRTFDVCPDGRVFVVDAGNRIWTGSLAQKLRYPGGMRLLFGNTAPAAFPEKGFFPFPFEVVRLENVADLRYVKRYDGLLVQDVYPAANPVEGLDERVHLRFLGLADRLVYPWIKTLVSGGYLHWNAPAGTYVTPLREGCMAFDQASATLYHLERNRNRLLRLADGLWATAKVSGVDYRRPGEITPDLLSYFAGPYVFENRQPQRFLDSRVESRARSGPYLGLFIGPSIISSTDLVPAYSLGRALEVRLQRRLGLCDGVRFDLLVRSEGGMSFYEEVNIFDTFVRLDGRADTVLLTARDALYQASEPELAAALEQLATAALRSDTQVLFIDANALQGSHRDALRPSAATFVRTKEIIRAAGFPIIEPSNTLLRESLEVSPFGNPPFASHHASPWAVECAADVIADSLYPRISAHLRDRVPARLQAVKEDADTAKTLRAVFEEFDVDWPSLGLPAVDLAARQLRYEGSHLDVFVDLGKLADTAPEATPETLEAIALAVLYNVLGQDLAGRMAVTVRVSLARFSNYDEYGAGVRDSARIQYQCALDEGRLREWIQSRFPGAYRGPAPPSLWGRGADDC